MAINKLTEEQVVDLREAFDLIDKNKEECILSKDFEIILESFGINLIPEELEKWIKEADKNSKIFEINLHD